MHYGNRKFRARELRWEMSHAEALVWSRLVGKRLGYKFRRQVPIGPYFVDFCCVSRRTIVEIDGWQHNQTVDYDHRRDQYLQAQGWRVVHIPAVNVMKDLAGAIQAILFAVKSSPMGEAAASR